MTNSVADKTYALFPNNNNLKIVSQLEQAGAKIISFPTPEAKIIFETVSNRTVKNLRIFDWIIFPDVLTVDFFLEMLETNEIDFFDLDEIRICALGEIVSDRLRFVQVHADVIPNTTETEQILTALENYVDVDKLKNLKLLLLKEINSESRLKKELFKTGAEVIELPIYRLNFTRENEISKLKALLMGGAIDEFIFSSPTDFIALKYIFNDESLAQIFSEIKASAVDGLIFQTAREQNLKQISLFHLDKVDKV